MKPKIFISSLISSMVPFRAAAKEAIEQLGCEAILAEDFGARPTSPQIACLQIAFTAPLAASYASSNLDIDEALA